MLIAHLSDFHLFSDLPETGLVRRDIAACARRITEDVAAFRPGFDAVMLTGDVADGGSDADYALVKEVLAPLKVPVFPVPGNHDDRAGFRRAFAGSCHFAGGTYLNYEARLGSARVLALDSVIAGRVEGELSEETLAWVAGRLADSSFSHTFLLIHHPPFLSGIHGLDVMSLVRGADALGALVAAYPGSLSILSGHIHRQYQAIWNGRLCAVGGSPAFQIGLELTPGAAEPGLVSESYGYLVHRLDGTGISIHRREVAL